MTDLIVIILTKDEEKSLKRFFALPESSVVGIVVVDSNSIDNTVELAKSLGGDVIQHLFKNHAAQFKWTLENIGLNTEWVMKMYADEKFTSELTDEINRRLDKLPAFTNRVILRRRGYFIGCWLRYGGKYPDLLLRICCAEYGISEMKMMNGHLIIKDREGVTFQHDFFNNNSKSLECWISKYNWYSNKEVLDQQMKVDVANEEDSVKETEISMQARVKRYIKKHGYYSLHEVLRIHLCYIHQYYFKKIFLNGIKGKIYTILQAYWYRFLVDAQIYECEKLGAKMEIQGALKAYAIKRGRGIPAEYLVWYKSYNAIYYSDKVVMA